MKNPKDGWSWTDISFAGWRRAVDRRLKEIYLITIDDAGIDDELLKAHWEEREPPFEFVSRFGNRYDLDPAPIWSPYQVAFGLRQLRAND